MSEDAALSHVHCPRCGREMRRGELCSSCGALTPIVTPVPTEVLEQPSPIARTAPAATPPRPTPSTVPRLPAGRRLPQRVHAPPVRVYRPSWKPASRSNVSYNDVLERVPTPVPRPVAALQAAPRTATAAVSSASPRRKFRVQDIWKRYLPPVRLVWIFLAILTWDGGAFDSAAVAGPILLILGVGIMTDLGFQYVRFPKFRIPDTAIATSLFIALIIWPAEASLALASVAVAGVGMRHFFRIGGHPMFNPAALGLTFAVLMFALPNSWHVGVSLQEQVLVAIFGTILIVKAPHTWRFPVFFFAAYIPLVLLIAVAYGGASQLGMIFTTEAIGSQAVFFAFFMVSEPRTAPSSRRAMIFYALMLGGVTAFLPLLFTELPYVGGLGMIAPFLALFLGNAYTVLAPASRGQRKAPAAKPAAAPKLPVAAARTPVRTPMTPAFAATPRLRSGLPSAAGGPRFASARESVEH
ncbi:MAG: RnfABCDGE type electron transport complex subunit D [Thermoplasmata archaeon]|nr:RnfABCDGE type electron transport complex subunit D [Thermoplasmata archaeon]